MALLCPGQGAQRVGMARDLAEAFPAARAALEAVDEALGFALSAVMWNGPEELLTRTDHAQPAILAHSWAVWAVAGPALGARGPVAAAAGHSLGEYSAYVAAGSLSGEEAARLVRRRGELMRDAGVQRPGTMAAVMGLDAEQVGAICREASGKDGVVVAANLNAPDQVVISGDPAAVARAGELLKAAGAKRVIPLKVSGAFHSPLMDSAAKRLAEELDRTAIRDARCPVIANVSAAPVQRAEEIRDALERQVLGAVRWEESMRRLLELGAEGFVEIGAGRVLRGLLRSVDKSAASWNVEDPATLAAALGELGAPGLVTEGR